MTTLTQVQGFLANKKLIVAGASATEKKFGNMIFKKLIEKGFDVIPVNPNTKEISGYISFETVSEVPEEYTKLYIVTPKSQTDAIIKEAAAKGIKDIWVQQSSDTPETRGIAKELGINLIDKKCMFMFLEPVTSIHKFHKAIVKLFGSYPKN